MPHFGLMEEKKLGPVSGPLQRARLHIRAGKRRLRQGKISAGIVTLYDAVSAAMESYAASRERRAGLDVRPGEDLNNEQVLYSVLVRSRVLDGSFDFTAFDRLTEKALGQDIRDCDHRALIEGIDSVMRQLGVTPFNESELPPEDPATF
jgi:hypothetical protein